MCVQPCAQLRRAHDAFVEVEREQRALRRTQVCFEPCSSADELPAQIDELCVLGRTGRGGDVRRGG